MKRALLVAAAAAVLIAPAAQARPMPTWGVRYGGPMNDQQITNLVNFLLSIQSDGKQRASLKFQGLGGGGGEHAVALAPRIAARAE